MSTSRAKLLAPDEYFLDSPLPQLVCLQEHYAPSDFNFRCLDSENVTFHENCTRFASLFDSAFASPSRPDTLVFLKGQWTFVSWLPIIKQMPLDLKSTINLPKTAFPMKANLPQNEPKALAGWEQMRIYERIRQVRQGARTYVLHDGPPYANGPIHLGTAMGKCLKDFIVKSKTMAGLDSPFVPGWDCHGLPI